MERFTIIAAMMLGVLLMNVPGLAQSSIYSYLTGSVGQSVYQMLTTAPLQQTDGQNLKKRVGESEQLAPAAVLFSDNFGTAAQNPISRTGYTAVSTGTSNWELRTTSASSGYTGASGGANVFTNLSGSTIKTLTYDNNLSTVGYTGISISFGAIKSGTIPNLDILYSTDGVTYNPVGSAVLTNTWSLYSGTLPADAAGVSNLRIRFQILTNNNSANNFRIDDFSIQGTAVPVTPNLTITDVSQAEGNAGTSNYTFTVNLSSPAPAGGVTFDIATQDGTATTADNDYVQKSLTSQTIPQGSSSYTFDVTVNGDTTVETNETFFVNVTNVTGANVSDGQGQGTIVNDDNAGAFAFSSATYTVTEGGTIDFTINRTGGSSGAVTVNYTVNYGTATNGACGSGADSGNSSGSVMFADGQTSFSTGFGMCDDAVYELPETLTLNITSVTAGSIGSPSSATVTINDNDQAPQFTITDVYQSEGNGGGTTNFDFTVTKTGLTEYSASVDAATSDGTANVGTDYAANSQTLSFAPNETTKTFTVAVNADTDFEPDENFFVNLSNAVNAVISDNQGVGTIFNDDVNGTVVQFERGNYQEDESQTVSVFVNRTGDTTGTTTVEYFTGDAQTLGGTSTPGTSCTGAVDYITTSGILTFNPGDTQKEIQIPICGDNLKESFEVFPVQLTNATGGTIGEIATAYVEIDDAASQFVNHEGINIGTSGDTIDSSITVTNAPAFISSMRVTLFDFQHINSDNIDVLLVGPNGQNILLMADAGGADGLDAGASITFDDDAGGVLSDNGLITTGSYEPTTWEPGQTSFTAPAPAGPYNEPGSTVGGTPTLASVFGGTNANGTWHLYIRDDNGALREVGIGGSVAGGWGLSFIGPTAAGVSVSGLVRSGKTPLANVSVMITGGSLTQPLYAKTNNFGNYSFEGLAAGQTYVVTVISNRYNFPQSSIVLNVEDNVTGADFEAEER